VRILKPSNREGCAGLLGSFRFYCLSRRVLIFTKDKSLLAPRAFEVLGMAVVWAGSVSRCVHVRSLASRPNGGGFAGHGSGANERSISYSFGDDRLMANRPVGECWKVVGK